MTTERRLNEVILSITNRCNLRCAMCQIPEAGNREELNTEEVRRLLDDAIAFCPRSIVFSGGEPLLRQDIFDLIAYVNRQKINTCITSNGTLLTDEMAGKLSAAGIGVVNISIEGDEKTHDDLRGKGAYAKAVEALKHLAKYKIETTVAAIVSRRNYKALPQVIELAHQYGVTTVKFQPFSHIFLKDKKVQSDFFAPKELLEDITRSMSEVIRLANKYAIMTNPQAYLQNVPFYLCGEMKGQEKQKGCPALWTSCPISAGGDVYPCWVLSERIVGNVKKQRLSEIWGSSRHDQMRLDIETQGCEGCMMSCYDQNFGKYKLDQLISAKVQKLGRGDFYKRMYNRVYQKTRYILGKIANKTRVWFLMRRKAGTSRRAELLNEIRSAKEVLQNKLKDYE